MDFFLFTREFAEQISLFLLVSQLVRLEKGGEIQGGNWFKRELKDYHSYDKIFWRDPKLVFVVSTIRKDPDILEVNWLQVIRIFRLKVAFFFKTLDTWKGDKSCKVIESFVE